MPSKKDIPESPEVERRTLMSKEIRASQEGEEGEARLVISGRAAVYNEPSEGLLFEEVFEQRTFSESLKKEDVVALFNHNPDLVLGRKSAGTLEIEEDEKGLGFRAFPPDTQTGRDLHTLVRRGDIIGASIGFRVPKGGDDWSMANNGTTLKRTIKKAELFDISPATYPAYPQTSVDVRSKMQELKQEKKVAEPPWRRNLARRKLELIED